jgi:hypothetical protein
MQRTSKKERDKARRIVPQIIIDQILSHLGIDSLRDGDPQCREAKGEALEELPHAIAVFAAEGYAIYSQNSIIELYGMNAELYQMLTKIAMYGDAGLDTITTFRTALSYVLSIYCKAYALINEHEREELFGEALRYLVASYPFFLPSPMQPYPGLDAQGRVQGIQRLTTSGDDLDQ